MNKKGTLAVSEDTATFSVMHKSIANIGVPEAIFNAVVGGNDVLGPELCTTDIALAQDNF